MFQPASLIDQLREARIAARLSQRAVAAMAGIPQSQLSKIENGRSDPRVSTLLEIARALSLEPVLAPRRSLAAVAVVLGRADSTPGQPMYQLDADD